MSTSSTQYCINNKFMQEDVRVDSLPCLDCAVDTEEDRSLNIEVYRKPTHSDPSLLFDFHNPLEHKLVVIRTLNCWAEAVPTRKRRGRRDRSAAGEHSKPAAT